MSPLKPEGWNLALGAPKDWDAEQHGTCETLHVIATLSMAPGRLVSMISHWKPSPEELAALNAGGIVELAVHGAQHPPVWVGVRPADEPQRMMNPDESVAAQASIDRGEVQLPSPLEPLGGIVD